MMESGILDRQANGGQGFCLTAVSAPAGSERWMFFAVVERHLTPGLRVVAGHVIERAQIGEAIDVEAHILRVERKVYDSGLPGIGIDSDHVLERLPDHGLPFADIE